MMVSADRYPRIQWKVLAGSVIGTLIAGGIGGLLGGSADFDSLQEPPLTPPGWVFPVVWTVLYILMGIAAYLVWATRDADVASLLTLYCKQLGVNILWPFWFFRLEWRSFAFFWALLLAALVSLTMARFRRVSNAAFRLLIPYLLWSLFAVYLSLGFYLLNIPA